MIKPLSLIAVILCGLGIALYFYEQGAEQGQENLSGQILLKQLDTKNLNKIQVRSSEGLLELHQSQRLGIWSPITPSVMLYFSFYPPLSPRNNGKMKNML